MLCRKATASVPCCPQFTWKRHFETFDHAFRRAHQPTNQYADNTDFISSSRQCLAEIERVAPASLAGWSLTTNATKPERVSRHAENDTPTRVALREAEDVARRKQLANVAFCKLWTGWLRWLRPGGGLLPYQSGGGVPPEPHGEHGEREKSRNLWSPRENY